MCRNRFGHCSAYWAGCASSRSSAGCGREQDPELLRGRGHHGVRAASPPRRRRSPGDHLPDRRQPHGAGRLLARIGALLLAVFLVVASYYFHPFWNGRWRTNAGSMIDFMKNLGLFGAMLFIIANGSGREPGQAPDDDVNGGRPPEARGPPCGRC